MATTRAPYYGPDLALVHHRGFGFHAEGCAADVLALLEPLKQRQGVVLELGCGSGPLTRRLLDAGHRVIARDASPAMLDIARTTVPDVDELRQIVLSDDALPPADAIVSVGHVLNYLPGHEAIRRALTAMAQALRPDGTLAVDLCDLRWGEGHCDKPNWGMAGEDWAIISEFSLPTPDRYVREMTTFVRTEAGTWRRGHERHDNILVDTDEVPSILSASNVDARVDNSFGKFPLPDGLVAIVGRRRPTE